MDYVVLMLVGLMVGAGGLYAVMHKLRKSLAEERKKQEARAIQLRDAAHQIKARQQELGTLEARLNSLQAELDSRVISYRELTDENSILKRDLLNIDMAIRKQRLDIEQQVHAQRLIDERSSELATRYLKESVKWIGASLNANNYALCKQRLLEVVERCRGIGFEISATEEAELLANLKSDYEKAVRAAMEREEQARIRAQIREEQQREREMERELRQLAREREAIENALAQALARTRDEHSAEVEQLRARLAEAEANSQRAISQAQLTKSGNVYVISNIGSFGDGVFKVGMTRRLEPLDRVRELGDASVPFPFDVHMMISCDDAPKLENALHRGLHHCRINKTNPRKEFFKTELEVIRQIVVANHGEIDYVADAEALQYRQSLTMTEDDMEFIETIYDEAEDDGELVVDEA